MSGNSTTKPKRDDLEAALLDADGAKTTRRLDRELGNTPKLWLHANNLTPGDMKRARITLGVDPYRMIGEKVELEDRFIFMIWCLKSRDDPSFTLEQAEATPFGEFWMGDDGPPPTPPLEPSGSSEATPSANGSKPRRPRPAPASSSSSSSG
jgi:hypothetical protein